MIPQRNISLISNSLHTAGGRRIPESVIERDYVLAWLLSGLAKHNLRKNLAFKGGTALRRCWFEGYRFSEDLDFTLTRSVDLENILDGLDEIFMQVRDACGLEISFDRHDRHGHHNSHTFYLRYQGPLPAPNDVKVDITIREQRCFDLQERPIFRTYGGFSDLPDGLTVKTYATEEIAIEKMMVLSDRARNEPRDLYDLWYLFDSFDLRISELRPELEKKLTFRQRHLEGLDEAIFKKQDRLKKLWSARLSHQMSNLPMFEDVFREVQRHIRAAELPKANR